MKIEETENIIRKIIEDAVSDVEVIIFITDFKDIDKQPRIFLVMYVNQYGSIETFSFDKDMIIIYRRNIRKEKILKILKRKVNI